MRHYSGRQICKSSHQVVGKPEISTQKREDGKMEGNCYAKKSLRAAGYSIGTRKSN